MSVRHRWLAWQIVVVGTLVADAVVAWRNSSIALGGALACLAAMLALLLTTPSDAIVLSRGRSERIIVCGAAALYAIATFLADEPQAARPLAAFVVMLMLLTFVRRVRVSAWWVALIAWNPLVLVAMRG